VPELGAQLLVQLGEARDDEGDEEDEEADHHDDQHGGIDQAGEELLAEGERDALEVEVALQDFFQVSGALAASSVVV